MFDGLTFSKYHALGNDYLVVAERDLATVGDRAAWARAVCRRHHGVGSDGVLLDGAGDPRALTIINPDGSEAEKSGNGLRIFARYLVDEGIAERDMPISVAVGGGLVTCTVRDDDIEVAMGAVTFVGVSDDPNPWLEHPLDIEGEVVLASTASVGNPHCVVTGLEADENLARRLGPLIENHPAFPARTNVQFITPIDRERIAIEIWERGAGYTLASGSSSCAAAAVAHRLGLVDGSVTVQMPGGELFVDVSDFNDVRQIGPVTAVARGRLARTVAPE